MKKYLWVLFTIFILITPISNVIVFLVNNQTSSNINEILYPKRGWPNKDKQQLAIWYFLYEDSINKVSKANDEIINGFNDFYLTEFHKYGTANANKPGYDEIGIPIADIDDYLNNKVIHGKLMQIYMSLTLRTYFIEFTINQINNKSSNDINVNEYLNLWVMKYFQAGFYYQWVKIWIQDLGRTIEKSINIDFYTFSKYVQQDSKSDDKWSEPPIINKLRPLLILDDDMNKMINELYAKILSKK